MATIQKTVVVTDEQESWIKRRIESGSYADDSAYIQDLVRRDQAFAEKQDALKKAIQDGLDSGVSEKTMSEIWDEAEAAFRSTHE